MAKQDWQKIWKEYSVDVDEDRARLLKEKQTIRWAEMKQYIDAELKGLKGLKTIEVGSGLGDFSLLLSWEGAKATLADYSEEALAKAKARFFAHKASADYILADMLNVDDKLKGKYDISFSLGVAEHFENQDRLDIINAHAEVLRKGGLTFISVPYRYSFPYRIWMSRSIKRGDWQYGLEIPFSKHEIKQMAEDAGLETLGFIQSSFWDDVSNFFPRLRTRKLFGKDPTKKRLIDRFGYALVYVGKK